MSLYGILLLSFCTPEGGGCAHKEYLKNGLLTFHTTPNKFSTSITAATITSADCWIYKVGELWKSKLSKS